MLTLLWKKRIASLNVVDEFIECSLMLDNLRKSTENGPWLKVPVKHLVIRPIVSVDGWQLERRHVRGEGHAWVLFSFLHIVVCSIKEVFIRSAFIVLHRIELIVVEEGIDYSRISDELGLRLLCPNDIFLRSQHFEFYSKSVCILDVPVLVLEAIRLVFDEPPRIGFWVIFWLWSLD